MNKNEGKEKKVDADPLGLWLLCYDQEGTHNRLLRCWPFDLGIQSIQIHFICSFMSYVLFCMCVVIGNFKKMYKIENDLVFY